MQVTEICQCSECPARAIFIQGKQYNVRRHSKDCPVVTHGFGTEWRRVVHFTGIVTTWDEQVVDIRRLEGL